MNKLNKICNAGALLVLAMAFAMLLCLSPSALAHDAFSGSTEARLSEDRALTLTVRFAAVTVSGFVSHISDRDNQISEDNLYNLEDYLKTRAETFYTLTQNSEALELESVAIEVINAEDAVVFTLYYPGPVEGTVGFSNDFIVDTNPEFKSTLTILDAQQAQLGLFIHSADQRYNEVQMAKSSDYSSALTVFQQFLALGVHHILLGYDHLLFLMGLLVVCRNWRMAISIVTCFTIAHSLTLSIAALDLVKVSSYWVESAIALSILYVGLENFWTAQKPRFRWLLTSVFGLVHGLGFASVLRDIGLGSEGAPIFLPLLSFNLGVEFGQIVFTLIFLPLIWRLKKIQRFEKFVMPSVSLLIIAMGGYWFIVRIFGLD